LSRAFRAPRPWRFAAFVSRSHRLTPARRFVLSIESTALAEPALARDERLARQPRRAAWRVQCRPFVHARSRVQRASSRSLRL